MKRLSVLLVIVIVVTLLAACTTPKSIPAPGIASLTEISIDGLRSRSFSSSLTIETQLGNSSDASEYSKFYGAPYYNTYMASYTSDGLHVYTRVDVPPGKMPANGWPIIIFAHGYFGADAAPSYAFEYSANSYYGDEIDAWVKAGYVVLEPGFRGHGTVNNNPAQGLEYIKVYDNGSYLAPIFYSIDILNLLEGTDTLNDIDWSKWGYSAAQAVQVDTSRIFLVGHSQGGDAALNALVVSSSPSLRYTFKAASIFNGCFEGRVEQGAFYGPQEVSKDASADPAYFPVMPDWWDNTWYSGTITNGNTGRKKEMYETVRTYVADQANADLNTNSLMPVMATLDAHKYPWYIKVPLDLHFSDSDYYSPPSWNESLTRMIRAAGGISTDYLYPGNTHELQVVSGWSPAGAVSGRQAAIEQTIRLFNSTP